MNSSQVTTNGVSLFVRVEGGLLNGVGVNNSSSGIPFNSSWVAAYEKFFVNASFPTHLPVPNFVDVFEYNPAVVAEDDGEAACEETRGGGDGDDNECRDRCRDEHARGAITDDLDSVVALRQLGRAACDFVDSHNDSDAILLRNLNRQIRTAEDFAAFWDGCQHDGQNESRSGWSPMEYVSIKPIRRRLGGIDMVDSSSDYVSSHNEMAYNPHAPSRVAFYCLMDAPVGGETLVSLNADYHNYVPTGLRDLVRERGGLLHRRAYPDVNGVFGSHPGAMTWQKKTGTDDKDEAVRFFTDKGFIKERKVTWDSYGSLIVDNVRNGFNDNGHWDQQIFRTTIFGDGTTIPNHLLNQWHMDEWKAYNAFKLRPGDWIVLDNRVVRHGRLGYEDGEDRKRTILAVYTV